MGSAAWHRKCGVCGDGHWRGRGRSASWQRGHTLWKTPAAPRAILGGCTLEAAPWSEYRQARTRARAHPRGSGLLRPFLSDASDLSESHPRSVCQHFARTNLVLSRERNTLLATSLCWNWSFPKMTAGLLELSESPAELSVQSLGISDPGAP